MNYNLKMLHQAAELAAACQEKKNHFLGVLAKRQDGAMVKAINSRVKVPVPAMHAEAKVLRKTGQGGVLWIARVLKDRHTWGMARPCANCQILIRNLNVKKVYYTIGPGEYGVWYPNN